MALLDLLLGSQNPVAQWSNKNSGLLTGLGTSLLSDGMNFAPAQQGAAMDRQAAQQKDADAKLAAQTNATKDWLAKNYPDLAQAVDAGLPVSEAWQEAFKRQQGGGASEYDTRYQAGQQYGLTGDALNTFALSGSVPGTNKQNVTYSLTPTYGTDSATGKQGMGVTGSDGSFKIVDTGAFQPMGPGEVAGARATGGADAKTAAGARAALPSAELNFEIASKAADALLSDQKGMDEQFGNILGVPQQMTGAFPGTAKANFRNQLDQLTGQAFLNIRQALKGAGAVTDYEGQRGEIAISRAKAAADRGDMQAFQQAVIEFKDSITKGLDLLRQQANGAYSAGAPAVTGNTGNQTSSGVSWSVEP